MKGLPVSFVGLGMVVLVALLRAGVDGGREVPDLATTPAAINPPSIDSNALPNPNLTPGAIDPSVLQDNIDSTICVHRWTRTVRPPESYTEPLKRQQIREYGDRDHRLRDYEEDHLVPLELGGAPADPRNLWPEPHYPANGWGSYAKDRLENAFNDLVCRGVLPLAAAQSAIASDWITAYRRYVGPEPDNTPLRRYGSFSFKSPSAGGAQ
jgi:hypothetical protein